MEKIKHMEKTLWNIFYYELISMRKADFDIWTADTLKERYRFFFEDTEYEVYASRDGKICLIAPHERYPAACYDPFDYVHDNYDYFFSTAFDEVFKKEEKKAVAIAKKYGYDPIKFWSEIFPENKEKYPDAQEFIWDLNIKVNDIAEDEMTDALVEEAIAYFKERGFEVVKK